MTLLALASLSPWRLCVIHATGVEANAFAAADHVLHDLLNRAVRRSSVTSKGRVHVTPWQ